MTKFACVFPGQGSQSVGMLAELYDDQAVVRQIFDQASEALQQDLWALVTEGPAEKLNQTINTQPAMLAAGVACWNLWQQVSLARPALMAGHSLGEYSALVCSGALGLSDAIRLVRLRAELMQDAVPADQGAMAAIIGLDDEAVRTVCAAIEEGVCEAVNFNSPGQVVIAGEKAAVEAAMAKAKEAGAKRALALPVSVPSHCSLMRQAASELQQRFQDCEWQMPNIPVLHNQSAAVADSIDSLQQRLADQLYQPVLWADSVKSIQQQGVSILLECGPGKVLSGLTRRIDKSLQAGAIFDASSLRTSQELVEA